MAGKTANIRDRSGAMCWDGVCASEGCVGESMNRWRELHEHKMKGCLTPYHHAAMHIRYISAIHKKSKENRILGMGTNQFELLLLPSKIDWILSFGTKLLITLYIEYQLRLCLELFRGNVACVCAQID